MSAAGGASKALHLKYEKNIMLGRGAFGTVFSVSERATGKKYAVKFIPKENLTKA